MPILVSYARVKLLDESIATGPITTQNFQEFHFKNTGSGLDLYFFLKKGESGWHQSGGGPTIQIPQSFIDQIGQQIDQELVTK
jgi:hypothetical protein